MSMGIEVRGVIAMNGRRELCFFPDSRAEGVPLGAHLTGVKAAILAAPARRVSHATLAALDPRPPEPEQPDWRCGCGPDTTQIECPYHGDAI